MTTYAISREQLLNDIPESLACDAHRGTSFSPEKRGDQERASYADQLLGDLAALEQLPSVDQKQGELELEFERYRQGYRSRFVAYLGAKSRCLSTMITGPANFPTRRNQKRGETADRRGRELCEFRERALRAIQRTLCPEAGPIRSSDPNASQLLAEKIRESEQLRDRMKAENAAARKAGQSRPHPDFRLTNLGANIRRMKQRTAQVAAAQATPASSIQGERARLEDCPADNRVRLFFPGKPDEATRTRLKQRGFRWTPSLGCWQAYRNSYSLDFARAEAAVAAAPAQ